MNKVRVSVNDSAVAALDRDPAVLDQVMSVGNQVADRAAQSSDAWSDEGYATIHAELGGDNVVRVSWDQEHFYMLFFEIGTSEISARPFLRPALDGSYTP